MLDFPGNNLWGTLDIEEVNAVTKVIEAIQNTLFYTEH